MDGSSLWTLSASWTACQFLPRYLQPVIQSASCFGCTLNASCMFLCVAPSPNLFNSLKASVTAKRRVGLLKLSVFMASADGSGVIVSWTLWCISSGSSVFCVFEIGSFQNLSRVFICTSGHTLALRVSSNCLPFRLHDSLPRVLLALTSDSCAVSSLSYTIPPSVLSALVSARPTVQPVLVCPSGLVSPAQASLLPVFLHGR